MNGVTILVCTHNGAQRLPEALRYIANQQVSAGLNWEVVLVSNASHDDTLRAAPRLWAELGAPAPLRVFDEPQPGKENALVRGFDEAGYEYICIVDDDNWLYPDYLAQVVAVMREHPKIGILGACAEGAFEVAPPPWFEQFRAVYAVGPQAPQAGALRQSGAYVYGAGSVVRRAAWQHLRASNFTFTTSTKRGKIIVSGEDVELGDAMRLAGYELWYDPRLRLRHFMFKERLTWQYLLRIGQGTASSQLTSIVYYFIFRHPNLTEARFRQLYAKRLVWLATQIVRQPGHLFNTLFRHDAEQLTGNFEMLRLLYNFKTSVAQREEAVRVFRQVLALQSRLAATASEAGL